MGKQPDNTKHSRSCGITLTISSYRNHFTCEKHLRIAGEPKRESCKKYQDGDLLEINL